MNLRLIALEDSGCIKDRPPRELPAASWAWAVLHRSGSQHPGDLAKGHLGLSTSAHAQGPSVGPLLAPTTGRTQDAGDRELGEGVKKGSNPPIFSYLIKAVLATGKKSSWCDVPRCSRDAEPGPSRGARRDAAPTCSARG